MKAKPCYLTAHFKKELRKWYKNFSLVFFLWSIVQCCFLVKRVGVRWRVRKVDHRSSQLFSGARRQPFIFSRRSLRLRASLTLARFFVGLVNPEPSGRQHTQIFEANQPAAELVKHFGNAGVLIWDDSIDIRLKIRKHWEPDSCSAKKKWSFSYASEHDSNNPKLTSSPPTSVPDYLTKCGSTGTAERRYKML